MAENRRGEPTDLGVPVLALVLCVALGQEQVSVQHLVQHGVVDPASTLAEQVRRDADPWPRRPVQPGQAAAVPVSGDPDDDRELVGKVREVLGPQTCERT